MVFEKVIIDNALWCLYCLASVAPSIPIVAMDYDFVVFFFASFIFFILIPIIFFFLFIFKRFSQLSARANGGKKSRFECSNYRSRSRSNILFEFIGTNYVGYPYAIV